MQLWEIRGDKSGSRWVLISPPCFLVEFGSYLALLESCLRPGTASVSESPSPGCPAEARPEGSVSGPKSGPRGQSGTHSALGSPGFCGPSTGGMFDRGVHVFSKQTLIHVSRRNVQTDFCRLIRGEMGSVNKDPQAVSQLCRQTRLPVGHGQHPAPPWPLGPHSMPSPSREPQRHTATHSPILQVRKEAQRC